MQARIYMQVFRFNIKKTELVKMGTELSTLASDFSCFFVLFFLL